MSWNTGIPTPYLVSQIATPFSGLIAARQLDLPALLAANCPVNLPAFKGEDRLWGLSPKVGLVWICFTDLATDDANPAATPALGDPTAIRFSDLFPKERAYDPAGKRYMVVYDTTADNVFTVRHCF